MTPARSWQGGRSRLPARAAGGLSALPCRTPRGYRRCMPARKTPTAQDAATARQVLLDAAAGDLDLVEALHQLAELHPRHNTFPGEVFLHLAADALQRAGVDRAHPVHLEGLCERFLPELALRGRERSRLEYAVLAAAALNGGVEADVLDEVAWWQTDDFWRYAACAALACIRIGAARAGVPASDVCRALTR
jgi:hypothetical protein